MTRYLEQRTLFPPLIPPPCQEDLGMAIVIPAKDEEQHLVAALSALLACQLPRRAVEVIVVVNTSEADDGERITRNDIVAQRGREWAEANSTSRRTFHILRCSDLPAKHAGVGLARKIGMDEACRRLESSGNANGVIACFDADSTCDPNYLVELERLFEDHQDCQACSIYFEHPLDGSEYEPEIYDAITRYELHLRYFIHAQRYAGFPFATQTIGSSMAVRCDAYQAQNGMNRRKAGEDFYFLHKYTPLGHVEELRTTRVIPSPRKSHRVPFGTGKAVGEILDAACDYTTYSPKSFVDLKELFDSVDSLFDLLPAKFPAYLESLPASIGEFLSNSGFHNRVQEIRANVTMVPAFRVRFFRWFDAFLIMKFVHHARDHFHPNVEVTEAARWLLATLPEANSGELPRMSPQRLLEEFRKIDRSSP